MKPQFIPREGGLSPHSPLSQCAASVYLLSLSSQASKRSMRESISRAAQYFTGEGLQGWSQVHHFHVEGLKNQLLTEGLSPNSVNRTLSAVRGVMREAWRLKQVPGEQYHLVKGVSNVPGKAPLQGKVQKKEDLLALAHHCSSQGGVGLRDGAIILLLYSTGIRRQEAEGLDLGDYEEGVLQVRRGKRGKSRTVYLKGAARTALEEYLSWRGEAPGPLFLGEGLFSSGGRMGASGIYKMLKRRAKEAGMKDFSPHDLRRSFITHLLQAGADVLTVSRLAGHSSPATTARYDYRGEEEKQEAMDLLDL